MIAEWIIFLFAAVFVIAISLVMSFANHNKNTPFMVLLRPVIYALASAVFLSVVFFYRLYDMLLADGYNSIAIVVGPLLLVAFGLKFLKRLAKITRIQHIKSLPDLLAARYGKKYSVSVVTTLILLFVALPFMGVQIWYLDYSTDIVIAFINDNFVHDHADSKLSHQVIPILDSHKPLLFLMVIYAAYIAIKSTKHVGGTDGLLAALAVVMLSLFLVATFYFVDFTYIHFDGVIDVFEKFASANEQQGFIQREFSIVHFIILALMSAFLFIIAPWQFQLVFLENSNDQEFDVLRKVFLPLFSIFFGMILVISMAAIVLYEGEAFKFALLSAILADNSIIIGMLLYFISILVTLLLLIVEAITVSTIIGNDLLLPILIRNFGQERFAKIQTESFIISLKRSLVLFVLVIAYLFFTYFPQSHYNDSATYAASILMFQLAPALIGGVYWNSATARGMFAGIIAGILMWLVTMIIPILVEQNILGEDILTEGIAGIAWLRPTGLFGLEMEANTHAAFWAIGANILFFVLFSLGFKPDSEEITQNRLFTDVRGNIENPELQEWQKNTSLYDLQVMVGQYVGQDVAELRFKKYAEIENLPYELNEFAHVEYVKFARQELASAIGTSSARFVMALVMERKRSGTDRTSKLLDEASELIHFNRELLQSALDNINQGICVLDENLKLTNWNKAFLGVMNIPADMLEQGLRFEAILEYCARRGDFGEGEISSLISERILNYVVLKKTVRESIAETEQVVEVTSSAMPEGGCVITFDNVTLQVVATNELEIVNVHLEQRVEDRTDELTQLNVELERAKTEAEQANIDKTRFLAAASHDISQPMNAARLYSSALQEKEMSEDAAKIAMNLDLSLTSVEEILVALLDISRLDSGVYKAEMSHFGLNELFEQLFIEFKPLAEKKGLDFKYVPTQKYIYSDRRHLRRILQNFISNAVKYTEQGKVLFGCRSMGDQLRIDICDTGHGVAPFQIKTIFKEFKRLESGMRVAQGVGLGLSIVDRISTMIDAKLEIDSKVDIGSRFSCYVDKGVKPATAKSANTKPIISRNKLGPINVVCIDNEVEILKALETLLGNWGVKGIYTETSKDALQEIEQSGVIPDVIIADYHLNFENGVFAIEKIRWQIDHPIKAILATADRSEQVMKVCQAKDITLMYKPLKPAILRAILARVEVDED